MSEILTLSSRVARCAVVLALAVSAGCAAVDGESATEESAPEEEEQPLDELALEGAVEAESEDVDATDPLQPPPGGWPQDEGVGAWDESPVFTTQAAPKGPGPVTTNIEIKLDVNKWTGDMTKWLQSKSKGNHLHSIKDRFIFFEGNHCKQNIVGSMWTTNQGGARFGGSIKSYSWFVNDEARSVLIKSAKKGEIIRLADAPDANTGDDRTHIRIKKGFKDAVCVTTFEVGWNNPHLEIVHRHKNGLDGRVSYVRNY